MRSCLSIIKGKSICPFFNDGCTGSNVERIYCFQDNPLVYYLIDFKTKNIYFYHHHEDAKAKEKELGYKLVESLVSKKVIEMPNCPVEMKKVKNFYGTVWIAEEWTSGGNLIFVLAGRKKDLKSYETKSGYKIRKVVLIPYEEYINYYNLREKIEEPKNATELQKTLDLIEKSDVTKMFGGNE